MKHEASFELCQSVEPIGAGIFYGSPVVCGGNYFSAVFFSEFLCTAVNDRQTVSEGSGAACTLVSLVGIKLFAVIFCPTHVVKNVFSAVKNKKASHVIVVVGFVVVACFGGKNI